MNLIDKKLKIENEKKGHDRTGLDPNQTRSSWVVRLDSDGPT